MTERSITFNDEKVRATLDKCKTQERKIIKSRTLEILDLAAKAGECSPFIHTGVIEKTIYLIYVFIVLTANLVIYFG